MDAYLMGALFGSARTAAGSDQSLRAKVEEAHLRSGGPSPDDLLAHGVLGILKRRLLAAVNVLWQMIMKGHGR